MLDNLLNYYYNERQRRGKKGYEVIGKKLTTLFIVVLFSLGLVWFLAFFYHKWWLTPILIFLFILLFLINKKVDTALTNYLNENASEVNRFIRTYLMKKLKLNHSSQFKELANQLQRRAEETIKSYNIVPQLTMILTVFLFLGTLIVDQSSEYFIPIIVLSIPITLICLIINPLLNFYASIFWNEKSGRIKKLSSIINELYLEELINEHSTKIPSSIPSSNIQKNRKKRPSRA